ncbi:probable 2-oxoglutarate-dependent dioxygenase AOP1 [Panicum hallii]|nr:probable 2-oxoglutarate-dependent dioxygenase AOP1 [Panicum hallii]
MGSGDGTGAALLMEIPKVDLRGLEPDTPGWARARAAVTASMTAHGCVVVVHDALGAELRQALFGRALPQLFALPFEAKKRSGCFINGPHRGYVGQVPSEALESVPIQDAGDPGSIRAFSDDLWPQGNQEFCDTVVEFAKNMLELEQTVERLILEGLGTRDESIASHLGSLSHLVRMTLYGTPPDKETGISLRAHRDEHMTTVLAQHEVGGLEVQVGDGRWVAVPPEPGTLTVMAGDQFRVVTNGRVPGCVHRVRTPSGRVRFSALLNRRCKGQAVLRAIDELVDDDHPLMYNPCGPEEYRAFRLSEEGRNLSDPLKAFCGVER